MAGQVAMGAEWHEFAAGIESSKIAGEVGYARLPRGPTRSANMYGGTGIGINGVAPERQQRAAWLFVNWATSPDTQLSNLKSEVGGGTPTRESIHRLPEVEKARKPPSAMPNVLTTDAVFEAWKPENIGLRPKIAAWNECDTVIFTELSKMLAGSQTAEQCIHFPWKRDENGVKRVLADVESALAPFGARPHWGKMFLADAAAIAPLYERLPDFARLVERLDSRGAFRNKWLESRVLGAAQ